MKGNENNTQNKMQEEDVCKECMLSHLSQANSKFILVKEHMFH